MQADHEYLGATSSNRWLPARRRRLVLAIYLDFLLFSVFWAYLDLLVWAILPDFSSPLLTQYVAFAIVEFAAFRFWRFSPGNWLLGIRLRWKSDPSARLGVVDSTVKERENWVTILLGVLFLNAGVKGMVRWMMWITPAPFFGYQISEAGSIALSILLGVLQCLIAVGLLRLQKWSAPLGLALLCLGFLSFLMSWASWDNWVAEEVVNRRAYQGIPVGEGQVEFMQPIFVPTILAGFVLLLIGFLLALHRINGKLHAV